MLITNVFLTYWLTDIVIAVIVINLDLERGIDL